MKFLFKILVLATLAVGAKAVVPSSSVPATNAPSGFTPRMLTSVYAPEKSRDPFRRLGQEVRTTSTNETVVRLPKRELPASLFRLQAILLDRSKPAAVVNGELLTLNKSVAMRIGASEFQVKAVQIGRDQVVLDVDGQKVEVRLEEAAALPKPKQ